MGDYSLPPTIYEGASYTLEPKYQFDRESNSPYLTGTSVRAGVFSAPSNPQTANQIDAVSKKISTGLRNIEVSGVNIGGQGEGALGLMDNIPKQHFKEINRLKKLANVELTFHGPLVEPTGMGRGGWDPQQRIQAELEMVSAIERAHDLDPKGNIIVTFHASNGLPEPRTIVKDSKGNTVTEKIAVIDESTGEFGNLPRTGVNYFEGKELYDPEEDLKRLNQRRWSGRLNNVSIEAERAYGVMRNIKMQAEKMKQSGEQEELQQALHTYNFSIKEPEKYDKYLEDMGPAKDNVKALVTNLTYARANAEDAYLGLQDAFNQVMTNAKRDGNKEVENQLASFREKIVPKTKDYDKDYEKLEEFVDEISRGIRILQSIGEKNPPKVYRPLEEFALDKASTTFANVAFQGYKKFEDSAPVVSIENPPVGMGLSKSDELEKLVKKSREKFVEQAAKPESEGGLGMSTKEAEKEANKLIGVTWDVGHINMLRKYGFDNKDLVKQTEQVAPYIKHIHLSDNFGLEHTELPMGMGNVPIKEELAAIEKKLGKEYFSKVKQVIETGGWFRNFNNVTPFAETLEAFGSPIYGMKMAPYWNRTRGTGMGYFSGYGKMLPDVHFSTYGAGFSSLPPELGGQMAGRSRLSGTPNE